MKKFALVIVLLWATHVHAGVFKHVIKPVGKAVASASVAASKAVAQGSTAAGEAVAEGSTAAGEAVVEGSTTAAKASGKAVKKVVI